MIEAGVPARPRRVVRHRGARRARPGPSSDKPNAEIVKILRMPDVKGEVRRPGRRRSAARSSSSRRTCRRSARCGRRSWKDRRHARRARSAAPPRARTAHRDHGPGWRAPDRRGGRGGVLAPDVPPRHAAPFDADADVLVVRLALPADFAGSCAAPDRHRAPGRGVDMIPMAAATRRLPVANVPGPTATPWPSTRWPSLSLLRAGATLALDARLRIRGGGGDPPTARRAAWRRAGHRRRRRSARIAEIAHHGYGMRARPPAPPAAPAFPFVEGAALDDLLARSDAVVLACLLTDARASARRAPPALLPSHGCWSTPHAARWSTRRRRWRQAQREGAPARCGARDVFAPSRCRRSMRSSARQRAAHAARRRADAAEHAPHERARLRGAPAAGRAATSDRVNREALDESEPAIIPG